MFQIYIEQTRETYNIHKVVSNSEKQTLACFDSEGHFVAEVNSDIVRNQLTSDNNVVTIRSSIYDLKQYFIEGDEDLFNELVNTIQSIHMLKSMVQNTMVVNEIEIKEFELIASRIIEKIHNWVEDVKNKFIEIDPIKINELKRLLEENQGEVPDIKEFKK